MVLEVPSRLRPLVYGSLLVGAIILAFGWLSDGDEENGSTIGYVIVLILMVALAYALWRFVVTPRLERATATSTLIVLGVLSLLLGVFYWTGFVFALAPATIGLALLLRERGRSDGAVTAALVLGVIGLAIAIIGGAADSIF